MMKKKVIDKARIQQEHREIEQITANLYRVLAERQATRQRVSFLLDQLQERVLAHLNDEQDGGYICEESRGDPELEDRCRLLCEDHERLNNQLAEMSRLVESGEIDANWWGQLETKFHACGIEIINHENDEQEILKKMQDGATKE